MKLKPHEEELIEQLRIVLSGYGEEELQEEVKMCETFVEKEGRNSDIPETLLNYIKEVW